MKLVKFAPAIAATLVLAACSTADKVATATTDAVKATGNAVVGAATATKDAMKGAMTSAQPHFETAGYFCEVKGKRKVVSATYAFVNGQADSVTLTVDGAVVGDMKYDANYQDGTRFVNGNRVWSLDYGFAQNTVSKTVPVQYRSNNNIVAKNCEIAK